MQKAEEVGIVLARRKARHVENWTVVPYDVSLRGLGDLQAAEHNFISALLVDHAALVAPEDIETFLPRRH